MKSTPAGITPRFFKEEPLLIEKSHSLDSETFPWESTHLKNVKRRETLTDFPNLSEIEVVRHYTRLSMRNYSLEEGMYPLGSCTMKYNPKINEVAASMPGFKNIHPNQPEHLTQGAIEVLFELSRALCEITGMDDCTLQGAAGAQGEFIGLKVIQAYHQDRGENRTKVIIADSAHGTNAASCSICGLSVVGVESNADGVVTAESIAEKMTEDVAAVMLTIPNTLGIFEDEIVKITEVVHAKGGLVYCDGANLNALIGRVDFKKMGVDIMHMNLHKTFSTPHGGGGPGAGPVAAVKRLAPFLPTPHAIKEGGVFKLVQRGAKSIGRVKPFHGSFGVLLRAYAYILANGGSGLREVSNTAVLNACYVREKLRGAYDLPFDRPSLHEVVLSDRHQQKHGVTTMDIAKRLMDFGFHPPTVYFPLIVKGALMIEPTETTERAELDRFIKAMLTIAEEAQSDPKLVTSAPHHLGMKRLDEVKAARNPILTWSSHWHET